MAKGVINKTNEKILLLEDDPEIAEKIVDALPDYEITTVAESENFLQKASGFKYALILIDFDLKEKDGLLVFRDLRQIVPSNKTIMFSSSNSIPLAVQATKLGVMDFLRKPFDFAILSKAIDRAVKTYEIFDLDLAGLDDTEWLRGVSQVISTTLENIKRFAIGTTDLAICSEKGINRENIAKLLHRHGKNSDRRFALIDLTSFDKDVSESHFFLTLKELLSSSDEEEFYNKSNLPGTIFLSGIEFIPDAFRMSVIQFIKNKKSPIRIILSGNNRELFSGFEIFQLPTLRSRREDIPIIALSYLKKYTPQIKYIAPEVFDFLMYYDFPGNYDELRDLIQIAASRFPGSEVLNFKNLPVDLSFFKNVIQNKIFAHQKYSLNEVRARFEKGLIEIVMEKVNQNPNVAGRFLDIPHAVFSERIKTLGLLE
ncbi:hypothetical protein A3J90_06120 [candidate division WOR-1 bacterium RIFOXYC2_FULL_37_10]|uniref:Response regulatory domain-containing protein n=1 Tax=candidate division WOR-1 bacterium RIFOXYB2_FULL_37_13 TaxID=1802579 RepID=A0A1F4SWC4_UNCSA|nr:MAG: hypothetical protein A2246_00870 [candidate division WOR-1 bacterium RIFOXYA2_FULL_37_7]OGC24731.1 MAG: hypothetical protein A2310_04525 [candidate division WOR-1 bacterium RIFOXYB2_FULL_37_13]OGC34809.1 MAG: hypothetical protein A3J90_06120 [candidate division WOR-1 bacterium RIFOXYC2_FULL_37_10]